MKKLLAVVRRTEGAFRGYVPKFPGCEVRAATAEQAEADITAAARAHLAAGMEGTNGIAVDQMEIVVVVEPPPDERPYANGVDPEFAKLGREFLSDEELERLLNPEEYEWFTFEEMMAELGFDLEEPSAEGNQE